jgi:hypothetical protein
MKQILILFFLFQLSPLCFSQSNGLRIGASLGVGEATIKKTDISNQTGKLAFQGGLALNYQFIKNFGLYGNILYATKGSRSSGTERVSGFFGTTDYKFEEKYVLDYIEVPVMPKLSFGGEKFYIKIFAGPSLNFNLSGKQNKQYEDASYNQDNGYGFRKITGLQLVEYALVYGAGFDVEISDGSVLFLEIRQSKALNSFGTINNKNAYNQYFTLNAGYLIKY